MFLWSSSSLNSQVVLISRKKLHPPLASDDLRVGIIFIIIPILSIIITLSLLF